MGSAGARRSLAGEREETRHSRIHPSWWPVTAVAPSWKCAAQLHGARGCGGVRRASEVEVASSVDRSWSATAGHATTMRRESTAAATAAADGTADRGRSKGRDAD